MPSQTLTANRIPTVARLLIVGALALVQVACAGIDRPATLSVAAQVERAQGVRLYAPATTLTATGAKMRGFVCRGSAIIAPTHVQLERIGSNGAVISTHRTRVNGLSGRAARCAVYNIETDWAPRAGEQLRVCAPRSGRACLIRLT